jgi:hypothetical protein
VFSLPVLPRLIRLAVGFGLGCCSAGTTIVSGEEIDFRTAGTDTADASERDLRSSAEEEEEEAVEEDLGEAREEVLAARAGHVAAPMTGHADSGDAVPEGTFQAGFLPLLGPTLDSVELANFSTTGFWGETERSVGSEAAIGVEVSDAGMMIGFDRKSVIKRERQRVLFKNIRNLRLVYGKTNCNVMSSFP